LACSKYKIPTTKLQPLDILCANSVIKAVHPVIGTTVKFHAKILDVLPFIGMQQKTCSGEGTAGKTSLVCPGGYARRILQTYSADTDRKTKRDHLMNVTLTVATVLQEMAAIYNWKRRNCGSSSDQPCIKNKDLRFRHSFF
jgi:hypothetical protein